jgi:putative nucleotidyltransferase with HDIG domain
MVDDESDDLKRPSTMADLAKLERLPFAIDNLIDNSTTDFDLFLDVSGVSTLYAPKPYKWLRDELTRLLKEGHTTLFYSNADQSKVEVYRAINCQAPIDMNAPPRERIVSLTEAAAEMTRVLYEHPVTASSLAKGQEIANAMVETVREDILCVTAIGKLANHDYYTYYHSARVAAYALAIAIKMSEQDTDSLRQLSIGCLLHDIGKSKVDLAVLNKKGALTEEEWQLMKKHPVFGDELVAESHLSQVPKSIILHHHEKMDGSGYPHNLGDRELLGEVKIANFADVFDALTTNRPYQLSRNRFEALDFIRHKLLKAIDQASFAAMVAIMGEEISKKS